MKFYFLLRYIFDNRICVKRNFFMKSISRRLNENLIFIELLFFQYFLPVDFFKSIIDRFSFRKKN